MSTPTNIVLGESKLPSIQNRDEYLCKNFVTKILTNTELLSYETITVHYNENRKSKRETKRVIEQCIQNSYKTLENDLYKCKHYDVYGTEYETLILSIPINTEIGKF